MSLQPHQSLLKYPIGIYKLRYRNVRGKPQHENVRYLQKHLLERLEEMEQKIENKDESRVLNNSFPADKSDPSIDRSGTIYTLDHVTSNVKHLINLDSKDSIQITGRAYPKHRCRIEIEILDFPVLYGYLDGIVKADEKSYKLMKHINYIIRHEDRYIVCGDQLAFGTWDRKENVIKWENDEYAGWNANS